MLPLAPREDPRGAFTKVFETSWFPEQRRLAEVFLNCSRLGAVRGLHFQSPPSDHNKIVSCLHGRIYDVLLDLRPDSPSFGQPVALVLDASQPKAVFIPAGVAHGFQAMQDDSTVLYLTDSPHDPDRDLGINPFSVGVAWPLPASVVSDRDRALPNWSEFRNPFATSEGQRVHSRDQWK
jgi:dTDP-4-dehydrorhamnose 3,5-epimerase